MTSEDSALEALGVLGDPVRRRLYRHVVTERGDVGRDAAAEAVGISRSLAAFHLDKLVEAGLLSVTFRRLSGRTGPGAGRPAKLYRRAEAEYSVSVPPRTYGMAGRLLAEVVENAGLDRELQAAARAEGAALARAVRMDGAPAEDSSEPAPADDSSGPAPAESGPGSAHARPEPAPAESEPALTGSDGFVETLRSRGYQPFWDGTTLRLSNCPFHALAADFPALTCGMNLAFIEGLAPEPWTAAMDPCPGGCCVALSKNSMH